MQASWHMPSRIINKYRHSAGFEFIQQQFICTARRKQPRILQILNSSLSSRMRLTSWDVPGKGRNMPGALSKLSG